MIRFEEPENEGASFIEPFSRWAALGRRSQIESAFEILEKRLPVSERMLRETEWVA